MSANIVWGWLIVLYLWLAGMAGGAYIAAYLFHNLNGGRHRDLLRTATYVSIPLFGLGMLFLTLDLGRTERFWHLFNSYQPSSVMWFGTYFLGAGTVVGGGLALREWGELQSSKPAKTSALDRLITTLGFFFALIVVGYVGVLFAQTARPLWEATLLLPWLFTASAMSTGIALLIVVLQVRPINEPPEVVNDLKRLDVTFIVVELVLLAIFLIWLAVAGPPGRVALGALAGGGMGFVFWIGLVAIGLLAPLVLEWQGIRGRVMTPLMALGGPALVLFGGLLLRYVIVFAGQS